MDKILNLSAFGDVIKSDGSPAKEPTKEDKYGIVFKNLLQNMAQTKLLHWQALLLGQHKALDKLFKGLEDLGDKLIESLMGKYGRPVLSDENLSIKLYNFKNPKEGDLTEFMGHLDQCYNVDCRSVLDQSADSELINIIEEIVALIDQTKYLITLR